MIDNLKLKKRVEKLCTNENFVHHEWYFKYHLELVERIVNELKEYYPEADFELINSMVWFHDLDKIVKNQNIVPNDILVEVGFDDNEIQRINDLLKITEGHREIDINEAVIEAKILTSADGVAHFTGPFPLIYWRDNPNKPIEEMMADNLEKLKRDWERKIVIPELKKSFEGRYNYLLELRGIYPDKFIK